MPKICPLSRSARYGLAAVVLLLLITASFRFERLTTIPPGMHGDLAQYISDGLRISRSWSFPLSLDSRPEPLWRFYLGVLVWWTGAVPFTEKFGGIVVGLLTVAAAYRATLELMRLWAWTTPLARRLGALVAATALSANVALEFINRQGFRAGSLPLVLAIMLWLWARAWRCQRPRNYAWAGLAAGFPVNTYTAGLLAPLVGIGTLAYLLILGRPRPGWRHAVLLIFTVILATTPQLYLALRVPDLYGHIRQMQVGDNPKDANAPLIPPLPDLMNRINKATRTFYATGYYALNYNTPDTPFLNPILALLALIGVFVVVWNWRTLPGVLVGSMLVAMTLPGALSMDPDNSIRLCGTFVPLAALAGFGAGGLVVAVERLSRRRYNAALPRRALTVTALACLIISPITARIQFDTFWLNPKFWADPAYWLSFPHYFSINFTDFLTMLQHVDHPVYVPMPQIDSPTGSWYLTAQAYPNVKAVDSLDPLVGAQGLPDGELWYPYAAEYNVALPDPAQQFGLLLPGPGGRNGTIVILPPLATGIAATLRSRAEKDGTPIIDEKYGWRLGWRLPVQPADVTAPVKRSQWHAVHARFGDSIELIGYEAPLTLTATQPIRTTLYWRALKPMRFDAFSFAQFLDGNVRPYGTSDVWLYHWVYPSVFWKPGDVIPDVRVAELPPELPQGAYKLAAGIYTEPRQERLPVTDADGRPVPDNWLTLENHRVPLPSMPTAPASAVPIKALFGGALMLDAYSSDVPLSVARPAQTIHLRQYWHATVPVDRNYTVFVHVMDKSGRMIAQQDVQPFGGRYPTNVWAVGEPITLDFTLTIPAGTEPGPYDWRVGAYSFPSLERLAVTQDGQQPADRRAVLH